MPGHQKQQHQPSAQSHAPASFLEHGTAQNPISEPVGEGERGAELITGAETDDVMCDTRPARYVRQTHREGARAGGLVEPGAQGPPDERQPPGGGSAHLVASAPQSKRSARKGLGPEPAAVREGGVGIESSGGAHLFVHFGGALRPARQRRPTALNDCLGRPGHDHVT